MKIYYESFNGDPDRVPDLPNLSREEMINKVWPALIEAGAIEKKNLITGKTYLGSCRNSSKATWNGEKFVYIRYKFGDTYEEEINHFQDDDGYDCFIPIKML